MNIVAVRDDSTFAVCGNIIYWSVSGAAPYDALCAQLKAAGYSDELLPARMSPGKAVQIALEASHTTAGGQTKVMTVKDRPAGTVGLYQHQSGQGKSNYRCLWAVRANELGSVVFEPMAEAPDDMDKGMFMEEFNRVWGMLTSSDLGSWLADVVRSPKFQGLGLRQHGGIYFIPPPAVPLWQQLKVILTNAKLHAIPAMRGPDAINALADSLAEEASRLQEEITEVKRKAYLAQKEGAGYGPRKATLDRMAEQAARGLEKIQAYEKLLGRSLSNLSSKISTAVAEKETAEVLDL
jgi:hypothetical protein